MFTITVRDTHLRSTVEEMEVRTAGEAKDWAKQYRGEYPSDCGYKVTVKQAA